MTDSSSKTSPFSRLVGAPSPRNEDGDPTAAGRCHGGRRRVAALFRPSVESTVVALMCSGLAIIVAVLLVVDVYWLHDRVRVLELQCTAQSSRWTDNASGGVEHQVRPQITRINHYAAKL